MSLNEEKAESEVGDTPSTRRIYQLPQDLNMDGVICQGEQMLFRSWEPLLSQ